MIALLTATHSGAIVSRAPSSPSLPRAVRTLPRLHPCTQQRVLSFLAVVQAMMQPVREGEGGPNCASWKIALSVMSKS